MGINTAKGKNSHKFSGTSRLDTWMISQEVVAEVVSVAEFLNWVSRVLVDPGILEVISPLLGRV